VNVTSLRVNHLHFDVNKTPLSYKSFKHCITKFHVIQRHGDYKNTNTTADIMSQAESHYGLRITINHS